MTVIPLTMTCFTREHKIMTWKRKAPGFLWVCHIVQHGTSYGFSFYRIHKYHSYINMINNLT